MVEDPPCSSAEKCSSSRTVLVVTRHEHWFGKVTTQHDQSAFLSVGMEIYGRGKNVHATLWGSAQSLLISIAALEVQLSMRWPAWPQPRHLRVMKVF